MPDYRRYFVPGGSYFFTVNVHQRRRLFADPLAVRLLGSVMRRCLMRWPCTVNAIVLLPDHFHAIWTLPPGDDEYPKRWGWIKKEFTSRWLASGGCEGTISKGRRRERRRGIWQPRYWEHTLRDEDDFERHLDYIHYNPVKHLHVACPHQWPYSSFHRWVQHGVYAWNWACGQGPPPDFSDITDTVGE
jgi:putative transposase